MDSKLEKLKKLLEVANDGLSKADFIESFKKIVDQILKLELKMVEKIDYKTEEGRKQLEDLKQEFKQVIENARAESDNSLSGFKRKTIELINSLFAKSRVNQKLEEALSSVDDKLQAMDDKMSTMENGCDEKMMAMDDKMASMKDGKDCDPEMIMKEVMSKMPDHMGMMEEMKSMMDELKKEIEGLKKTRRMGGVGGGFSKMAMDIHIVDNEVPSGTPNGVLTTFTLANTPNPATSLKLYKDGQRLKLTEDYTLSNNTITFITAPLTDSLLLADYKI